MQNFFKPVITVLTVTAAFGSLPTFGQALLVKPDVKVGVKPDVKPETRTEKFGTEVLGAKDTVSMRQDVAKTLESRPAALKTQATILVLAAGLTSIDAATRNAAKTAYSFLADPNTKVEEARPLVAKLNAVKDVDESLASAVNGFFSTAKLTTAAGIIGKPSVPQVKQAVACGDTPEKLLAFESGVKDAALVSEFEAANQASKAVIPGGAWSDGACGLDAQTEEGGSSKYEVAAKVVLMKEIIGMKACNFTKDCAVSVFAGLKNMAKTAASPIVDKFVGTCKILRVANAR